MKIKREWRDDQGVTLIELLVVVIIVGVLAAIAVPNFFVQRQKGYDGDAKSDLRSMASAQKTYATDLTAFVTCSGATACKNSSSLGGYGFRASTGVKIASVADGTNGFCAVALSQSGRYYVYDSENGGLATYNSTTAPTKLNDGLSTGACTNVSSYPTPAA